MEEVVVLATNFSRTDDRARLQNGGAARRAFQVFSSFIQSSRVSSLFKFYPVVARFKSFQVLSSHSFTQRDVIHSEPARFRRRSPRRASRVKNRRLLKTQTSSASRAIVPPRADARRARDVRARGRSRARGSRAIARRRDGGSNARARERPRDPSIDSSNRSID